MTRFWKHAVPALFAVIIVLWGAENVYFMNHASARAQKACAGQTSFFDGPNSYYWACSASKPAASRNRITTPCRCAARRQGTANPDFLLCMGLFSHFSVRR
jgi:hypothetical protein